ncbi:MAG: prolyl oligopeptidase family serine peptidase [Candidatus Baltobacteraceae bacterium]
MKQAFVTATALAAALAGLAAQAASRPLALSDLNTIVRVSDARISPDGSQVLYIRSQVNTRKDDWDRTLMVVPAEGGAPRKLTPTASSIGSPRWSPGGNAIAFVREDAKKTAQLYAIRATGGAQTQLTHTKSGVEQYAWSPDGSRIAYVTQDAQLQAPWSVHDDGFLNANVPMPSHLWIVRADGSRERRLTRGTWSVLEAAPPFVGAPSDPSWSPDGRSIAFVMQANADDSDADRTSTAIADAANGSVRKLTGRTQYEYQAAYARQSNRVAYLYPHGPGPISVLNVFAGMQNLTPAFDRDVTAFAWLPGDALLLQAPQGAHTMLFVQDKPAAAPRALDTAGMDVGEFDAAKTGAIALTLSASNKPAEVYVLPSVSATPRALTHENAGIAALQYGKSVEVTWRAAQGERNDGVLTYPVGYIAGKKYPLVLRIHGGPESSTSMAFDPLRQLFAARGYVVLQPNYRGSDNLGSAHEHAIYKDPGTGPGSDVIAGVRAIEKLGIVDTKRESVTGHSYGGYMTGWMIGHWHNWRAAVEGDAMLDWKEEYDLSGSGNLAWTRDSLGGSPWNTASAAIYTTGSPITYASRITTPTRIISGTADQTVPVAESYALYHALHDRGVPVSFIAFPGMHHGPSKPSHIETYDRVTLEWVDRYSR